MSKDEKKKQPGPGRPPKRSDSPFAEWIRKTYPKRPDRIEFAKKLGISEDYLNQLRRGDRSPSGPLKQLIEIISNGEIKADSWEEGEKREENPGPQ